MKRISVLILLMMTGCHSSTEPIRESLSENGPTPVVEFKPLQISLADNIREAACRFLWQQQRSDGSWSSDTYGILSSGQTYTPFVLYALLHFGNHPPADAVAKALAFMRSKIKDGAIGRADPDVLEYPVYSTAYALICFKLAGSTDDQSLIKDMENYLVSEQFDESRGFDKSHRAYGGWGFGGSQPDGQTGHMDLAHVRRVLDALAMQPANNQQLTDVQNKAQWFLKMVQKHPDDLRPQPLPAEFETTADPTAGFDGGFYFSPVVLRANKGRLKRTKSPYWESYATATCDGLLALISANVAMTDDRVKHAIQWLDDHSKLEYSEGIPEFYEGENWRDAVTFYHLCVRGEVARMLEHSFETRNQIAFILAKLQNPDGSFVNRRSSLMKEDDPIMTTALAVIALGNKPIQVR